MITNLIKPFIIELYGEDIIVGESILVFEGLEYRKGVVKFDNERIEFQYNHTFDFVFKAHIYILIDYFNNVSVRINDEELINVVFKGFIIHEHEE